MNHSIRDSFSGRFGVFIAVVGSAVGLGNIWRFPYMVGEHGGGAFIIVYFAFVLMIGFTAMLSEFVIGRRGQGNSYRSFKQLSPKQPWYLVGLMGILAAFVIIMFYSTISGWVLEYVVLAVKDIFSSSAATRDPAQVFEHFHTHAVRPVVWQVVIMLMTAAIILFGVRNGIEKSAKILMPLLLVLMIILAVNSLMLPGASEGLRFLFHVDFSKIDGNVLLSALGQAVFSQSVGMGVMITYGSYIKKCNNLAQTAFYVSITNMLVAILAGIIIFPAVFSFGMDSAQGPGLVFVIFPAIFQQMTGGVLFALLFFVLVAIAALTSLVSLLEVVVAYCVEEFKMKRSVATAATTILGCVLGAFATLSFGPLSHIAPFQSFGVDMSIFDVSDFLASNILLPLGAFFVFVFLGWFYDIEQTKDEVSNQGALKVRLFPVFVFIIRYVAPLAILLVFLRGVGLI